MQVINTACSYLEQIKRCVQTHASTRAINSVKRFSRCVPKYKFFTPCAQSVVLSPWFGFRKTCALRCRYKFPMCLIISISAFFSQEDVLMQILHRKWPLEEVHTGNVQACSNKTIIYQWFKAFKSW